jgi:hypothetical protein
MKKREGEKKKEGTEWDNKKKGGGVFVFVRCCVSGVAVVALLCSCKGIGHDTS